MEKQPKDMQRAATAFRSALEVRENAERIAHQFPTAAAKLQEAARMLVRDGQRAESGK